MGFFLTQRCRHDVPDHGALRAVDLLQTAIAAAGVPGDDEHHDDGGLGRLAPKRFDIMDPRARGVAPSFILGRSAESKHFETDGRVLRSKLDGSVIARRRPALPGEPDYPGDTVRLCLPTAAVRGDRELVRVTNGLLRIVKSGIKVGIERGGSGYLTLARDEPGFPARLYWPGGDDEPVSCATFKLTETMKRVAFEELRLADAARRSNLDPTRRSSIRFVRRNGGFGHNWGE